jgi:acyl carrier protein
MSLHEHELRAKLREFIEHNMNVDDVELGDADNIFGLGYVTSIFAMRLLNFIEKSAAITLADDEIVLANFSSIDAMTALVRKHDGVA